MNFLSVIFQQIQTMFSLWTTHKDSSDSGKAIISTLPAAKKADVVVQQAAPPVVAPPKPGVAVRPKFFLPATTRVTSPFGNRILFGGKQWHPGVDFAVSSGYGTPILACEPGTVILNKQSPTPDKLTFVAIRGDISGCFLYYCHMGTKECTPSTLVAVGQHVPAGMVIGFANSTGMTTGPHSHIGCYTKSWVCIDYGLYLKKYAPELFAQLINYQFTGELDPSNKTNSPAADL